jgi:hypothetical protein
MTHDQSRESLGAYALDVLDASERDAVAAHLEGCASCRSELESLRAVATELAFASSPLPMPAASHDRVHERLMARAATDHGSVESRITPSSSPAILIPDVVPFDASRRSRRDPRAERATWIAAAAGIVAIASIASLIQARSQRDELSRAMQLATADKFSSSVVVDSLRAVLLERDKVIANITGPQVAVVTLTSNDARSSSARMFWDQSVNAWTFVAHNLPAARAGHTYQVWLLTAKSKISAGTFAPLPNGEAMVRATYPLPKDALVAVAVTEEPAAGSLQPTAVPFILGTRAAR